MSEYYLTYGEFQNYMKEYYQRTGHGMQFTEMVDYLYRKNLLHTEKPDSVDTEHMAPSLSDREFDKLIDSMVITLVPESPSSLQVNESAVIPRQQDVFVIRHPRYTRIVKHSHNYFELNYVASGSCDFYYKDTSRTLNQGELCLIAPGLKHDIQILDDSTVFCIMIRQSTFNTSFFSLLSGNNLLSYFFRTILHEKSQENFLLFFSEEPSKLTLAIRFALIECMKNDEYTNIRCISWINILLSDLLRNYSKTLQFYDYSLGKDFSLVLQYIQHNYQTLTLSSLAEFFHYSEPYLSTLIRQNTGKTFTELIRQLRLNEAVRYLLNTDMKVSEIADRVGYNSADHFSRTFRAEYHLSPQLFRKKNRAEEVFIPFSTT